MGVEKEKKEVVATEPPVKKTKKRSRFSYFVLILSVLITLGYIGFSGYNLYTSAQVDTDASIWWNDAFQMLINVATFLGIVAVLEDRAKNKDT